jgi:uncharacterized membrane protein
MKYLKDIENVILLVVTIIAAIILCSYLYAFLSYDWVVSKDPLHWGPLGDYFGGMLNPIIALAALFALIRATKFQKSEFNATRVHLEREAKKNEIYRLITRIEKRIDAMLEVEVKNDSQKPTITFGPLNQYLTPGWKPPRKTFISLGNSSLCTPIKQYSGQLLKLILKLEELLKEYDFIEKKESVVSRHLMNIYNDTKQACREQVDG